MKQAEKTKLTYERIVAAAEIEFGRRGYAGASLNNICAEIPKGLLYHNFKGRDDVYLARVERCFSSLTERLKAAAVGADIKKYMAIRLDFFRENENTAHIFFEAVLQPPEALRGRIGELRAEFDELNRQVYGRVLASVTLRNGVSDEDAMGYFSMMQTMFNGYFSSAEFRGLTFSEKMTAHEAGLARLLDFMLYGIAEKGKK